jgi:hypothetical protein
LEFTLTDSASVSTFCAEAFTPRHAAPTASSVTRQVRKTRLVLIGATPLRITSTNLVRSRFFVSGYLIGTTDRGVL